MVGNKETVASQGIGTVKIRSVVNNKQYVTEFQDVLYAPDMMYNLISCSKARRKGFRASIDDSDNDSSMGIMRMIEKQNGVTRVVGVEMGEGSYEAAVKPLCIDK